MRRGGGIRHWKLYTNFLIHPQQHRSYTKIHFSYSRWMKYNSCPLDYFVAETWLWPCIKERKQWRHRTTWFTSDNCVTTTEWMLCFMTHVTCRENVVVAAYAALHKTMILPFLLIKYQTNILIFPSLLVWFTNIKLWVF